MTHRPRRSAPPSPGPEPESQPWVHRSTLLRARMQVAVAVNLALMLPEAFFAKAWKGAPLGSLLEGLLGLQMAVQFWGGLVVFLCVSGWRLFGLAASLLVLPFFVAAVAIIGFHI